MMAMMRRVISGAIKFAPVTSSIATVEMTIKYAHGLANLNNLINFFTFKIQILLILLKVQAA
jgi:hypothetical protein